MHPAYSTYSAIEIANSGTEFYSDVMHLMLNLKLLTFKSIFRDLKMLINYFKIRKVFPQKSISVQVLIL